MQGERKKTAKKAAREECRNKKTEGKREQCAEKFPVATVINRKEK